ncbi:hypothetical protein F3Y22_tig00110885pilonHSYRG00091 [Hibiscus syriacus]|uniref:FCP1 homology domain-containing protein n=1 Tax=Hibiscus syriacus TaxID=106335 RepID=A0A6A2ZJ07_HIBSY|nr:hypothetical protein F3Y22_tig00110885pilonHSYRG00091 [Hibiscus syriacus]
MVECKMMKEDGTHNSSVTKDVRSKWNSMSDAQRNLTHSQGMIVKNTKNGGKHMQTRMCRQAILGVQNKGKSVVEVCRSKNWKALASKYSLNHKVTYAEVEEDIKIGSYREDELKARVLLYLVGIFLCPMGDTSTNKDNMKLICDEGLKGEFNWAEYVHSRLIESIITFQKGSQRYLKGCIAILEVALFNYWSGCDSLPAYERHGVARIRAWENEEVVRVMAKLKLMTGGKNDGVVKEVVEIRSELSGMEEEEKMEEMRRNDVTNIYTPESYRCRFGFGMSAPRTRSRRYTVISMGNQYAQVSDVAMLKPMEWVVVIDLLAWTVCYDSKKSGRMISYIPYHLAQQVLNNGDVEGIASFWGTMLPNYMKFTNYEKIMITINYNNSHWYMLVLDMVKCVGTVYDSLFKSKATKQRVNDSKRLMKILDSYNEKHIWVEACGSLGKVPLQRFKFVEHKMTEQLNGYDCGIYVMMWMESIGCSGTTCDFETESSGWPWFGVVPLVILEGDRCLNIVDLHLGVSRAVGVASRVGFALGAASFVKENVRERSFGSSSEPTTSGGHGSRKNHFDNFVEKVGWKRVKDVRLDLEREDNEDDQPMGDGGGDAMIEEAAEASEAQVGQDVTITTVMEYMVNFREHIDSLVSGMRADISSLRNEVSMLRDELHVDNQAINEDDDDDDPNKYIVSAMPPARKLVIFYVNGVLAYIPRYPEDVILRNGLCEFMQFCTHNFVVGIWSSNMRHNMDSVLDKLRSFYDHFLFVWDQRKCKTADKFTYCKDLNDVWNEFTDFNVQNTLLVDDSPRKMIHNPINNYICPHSFDAASHSDDDALKKSGNIREYLENLLKAPNVSNFVSDNPFPSD